jgi:hypothetical protein
MINAGTVNQWILISIESRMNSIILISSKLDYPKT